MNKRIIVTGATGFVGRQIVRSLASSCSDIVVVVRRGKETQAEGLPGVVRVVATPDLFDESPQWWTEVCADVDTGTRWRMRMS